MSLVLCCLCSQRTWLVILRGCGIEATTHVVLLSRRSLLFKELLTIKRTPVLHFFHSKATAIDIAIFSGPPSTTSMSSPSPTSKFSPLRHNPYDSAAISSKTRPMRPLDLPSGSIENQSSDSCKIP
ncbi:hypothetical protein EV361DRAFT_653708 [Lentinula raphanica]|nr:hypothetical protein EV361DRAFT_653708 [Lentinula raphanica]